MEELVLINVGLFISSLIVLLVINTVLDINVKLVVIVALRFTSVAKYKVAVK